MTATEFDLTDRLGSVSGTVAMTGVQALMRVPLDQQRADAAAGLRTAGLVAGYRGSPITGIDEAYDRDRTLLEAHEIRFISGVNEDLAATMIWGSQSANLEPDCRFDGVMGLWYGKGPGIDRSLDALRHANLSGVGHHGGVIAAVGDDPACKSSTVPSASEALLANLGMPALYPATGQDLLDFGRWAYELSRVCGLWVGMKIHTDVADQYGTVEVDPGRLSPVVIPDLGDWTPMRSPDLVGAMSLGLEADAFGPRLNAARAFVAANGLDRQFGAVVESGAHTAAKLGIVAAGKSYGDVRGVLATMGLGDDAALARAGIRLYKPAVIWPLEPAGLRRFVDGLEEIVVVEEKRSFVEAQVRDLLFDLAERPRVIGKTSPDATAMLQNHGALTTELILPVLQARIAEVLPEVEIRAPRTRIPLIDVPADDALPGRTPYFCSGCPHNRSTVAPEGSIVGLGIGCHTMSTWMDRSTSGLTHMGGEGAQWAGMAPFVGHSHRFQNLGDGTLFHSGSVAIRQAVSAGTNITYRILYNGTVAMTGGQDAAGNLPVPDLTRMLEAEGVVQTVVVTDDPDKYGGDVAWAHNTRVEHRDDYDAVQRELRDIAGVTAVIYDQRCAAELRRDRKRGRVETPTKRIMINEAVCDGCGDCGRISNCVSVHPVDTEFGRKTRIHQESCNYDYTCVDGNCPAFITVEVDPDHRTTTVGTMVLTEGPALADPTLPTEATVLIVGVGGTGVVTVNQVLATAALLDGKASLSLDQTGLAQKGGQVISNLRITPDRTDSSPRVGAGEADVALIFDVVGGTSADVAERLDPGRTRAVVSTALLPTGQMVSQIGQTFPELDQFRERIDARTAADHNLWLDAEGVARRVFASQPAANMIVVGLAYQSGLLPVSAGAIESAITQNGVAVDTNIGAFRLGRRLAVEPELLDLIDPAASGATAGGADGAAPLSPAMQALVDRALGDSSGGHPSQELMELVAVRVPELVAYADADYAAHYADVVATARQAEQRVSAPHSQLSETVAFQLFKLMAYKDEYEVARLHLRPELAGEVHSRFGPNATFSYMLEPPTLKKLGLKGKRPVPEKVGRAMFSALTRSKRARGTRADPFGRAPERRLERELIVEYPALVKTVTEALTADNLDEAVRILDLADQIRGFDSVKLDNAARYRSELVRALETYLS